MATASLTISYKLPDDGTPSADVSISLEMDEERNTPEGEDSPRSPTFGIPVFFLVRTVPENLEYQITPSEGTVSGGEGVTMTRTESLTFAASSEASVGDPITAITGTSWRGVGPAPAVTFDGNKVGLNRAATGILEVTYTTTARSWSHTLAMPTGYDTAEDPGYNIVIAAVAPDGE